MKWFHSYKKPTKKDLEKTIANSKKSSEKAKESIDRFLRSLEDLEDAIRNDDPIGRRDR